MCVYIYISSPSSPLTHSATIRAKPVLVKNEIIAKTGRKFFFISLARTYARILDVYASIIDFSIVWTTKRPATPLKRKKKEKEND